MTYLDKSFCAASHDGRCVNDKCHRFMPAWRYNKVVASGHLVAWSDFWDGCEDRKPGEHVPPDSQFGMGA